MRAYSNIGGISGYEGQLSEPKRSHGLFVRDHSAKDELDRDRRRLNLGAGT
jgi:hypothetical protein